MDMSPQGKRCGTAVAAWCVALALLGGCGSEREGSVAGVNESRVETGTADEETQSRFPSGTDDAEAPSVTATPSPETCMMSYQRNWNSRSENYMSKSLL